MRLNRATVGIAVVSIAVLALAACGGQASGKQPTSSPSPGVPWASVSGDFHITVYQAQDLLGGQELKFSELFAHGKPVVLNMWAGLCPPCQAEMPDLQEVYDTYADRMVLFGLDVGPYVRLGSNADGLALLRKLGISYPAGTTSDSAVTRVYQITGMPTTFFIKPNGQIHKKWTGLLTRDKFNQLVQELLQASATS